jgi:hypothetical protein
MKTFVGVDPGAASCLPPFAGPHRITRTAQSILRTKSRDQPVGNTREHLGENADLAPCAAMPANSAAVAKCSKFYGSNELFKRHVDSHRFLRILIDRTSITSPTICQIES